MKPFKTFPRQRSASRADYTKPNSLEPTPSTPDIPVEIRHSRRRQNPQAHEIFEKSQPERISASETNLSARSNDHRSEEPVRLEKLLSPREQFSPSFFGDMRPTSPQKEDLKRCLRNHIVKEQGSTGQKGSWKQERVGKCGYNYKKSGSNSPMSYEADDPLSRQIREIHNDTRKSARVIRDSRARLLEIQKKTSITEADIKELGERNELLLREMERFDRLTRNMQKLVGAEVSQVKRPKEEQPRAEHVPEPAVHHEMKMNHPTVVLAAGRHLPELVISDKPIRSKSEIDLTRKLNESYDMQEKLVADNADLEVKRIDNPSALAELCLRVPSGYMRGAHAEHGLRRQHPLLALPATLHTVQGNNSPTARVVKPINKILAQHPDLDIFYDKVRGLLFRYILYKELMTKDQNLETSRAQVKRLQGELKMMSKENTHLQEKLSKNNPKGDAISLNDAQDISSTERTTHTDQDAKQFDKELIEKLTTYKSSTQEIEKQLGELEIEVRHIRVEMANSEKINACRGGGSPNTCFQQPPGGPPVPPMTRACGVCPPCPAPCNPNAPPTPAEKEVQKLTIQLRQTEENFKTKVTECAMLRVELLKKKEELEKERCQHREVKNKLRELEIKFEGLANHTNMMLGTKEQALEQEVNVRALKQCYREAREEIDELRMLMKEQNDQLQDYRVKYLQAQQLVEEQRRQMDMMDMDNTRISEQINLEIQKVKLKFQEKLQELAPIPDLLKATQMRLKDAQQAQAIAEHNAEQLARELNCAREKVHQLLHNSLKPPPDKPDRSGDEKQLALLQQRIAQLTESNQALKGEVERLKSNVIRMEEAVLANEKRLQEKMHECAQLGGELDRARDEAARALQRANERTETIRKCMQTTVAELERQLAASRAQVKTAEKNREEIQCRMQCQIKRLNDNFEQASLRILGLQTQVQTLRRTVSSTGEGDGDPENQECTCKSFFDQP